MKVLMVLEAEFPPDERVEKEISSLIEKGFEVAVACYTRKGLPVVEKIGNYTIFRKKISTYLYKSSAGILIHPFYFRFWYQFLDHILSCDKFDIIHIHDLPLAKTGYELSRKYELKLVCDQHEFYSNWIVRTKHYNTAIGKTIRFFSNWKKYERKYLTKADLVITVEDPLKRIYIEQVGVSPEKIITLPNTPLSSMFKPDHTDPKIIERYKDRFVLFYAGGLDHLRGIDFIMKGVDMLRKDIPEILFLVAGKENKAFSMKEMIIRYNLGDLTEFIGWVPLQALSSYIAAGDICLFVPRADNLEINNTIATKIYQYAAMGKPVIVSEAKKMKEFVESCQIGYAVKYGDVEGFCNTVMKIYKDPAIAVNIRTRAVNLAMNYTWEKTSANFLTTYLRLIKNNHA